MFHCFWIYDLSISPGLHLPFCRCKEVPSFPFVPFACQYLSRGHRLKSPQGAEIIYSLFILPLEMLLVYWWSCIHSQRINQEFSFWGLSPNTCQKRGHKHQLGQRLRYPARVRRNPVLSQGKNVFTGNYWRLPHRAAKSQDWQWEMAIDQRPAVSREHPDQLFVGRPEQDLDQSKSSGQKGER